MKIFSLLNSVIFIL